MKNDNNKEILNRKLEREFLDKEIEEWKVQKIIEAINNSPSSMNFHDFSAIIIHDKEFRKKLSLGIESQSHIWKCPLFIIFCTDYNRMKIALELENKNISINGINNFITSVGDAHIASSFAHAIALTLGLGCCYIGLIKWQIDLIQEELKLTKDMIPLVGLCFGYSKNNDKCEILKPKLNKVYENAYNLKNIKNEILEYNSKISQYYKKRISNNKNSNWSKETCNSIEKFDLNKIDPIINSKLEIK